MVSVLTTNHEVGRSISDISALETFLFILGVEWGISSQLSVFDSYFYWEIANVILNK